MVANRWRTVALATLRAGASEVRCSRSSPASRPRRHRPDHCNGRAAALTV